MAIITVQDFKDTAVRFWQRGASAYIGKIFKSKSNRTIATFDNNLLHANWWLLPHVHHYLQQLMQIGNCKHYMQYVYEEVLNYKNGEVVNVLSVGCGNGSQEMLWANLLPNAKVLAIDITPNNIEEANSVAAKENIKNIDFKVCSWETLFAEKKYDIVLFHSSLHHLKNMESVFLKIESLLNHKGILVIHDYVGAAKHQFGQKQLDIVNAFLKETPKELRKIFNTPFYKNSIGKPGLLRMYVNDPSEAVEADKIRPLLAKHTQALYEKELGGNAFVLYLKDIAHHFAQENDINTSLLKKVFNAEMPFVANKNSDFIFGVYTFKN